MLQEKAEAMAAIEWLHKKKENIIHTADCDFHYGKIGMDTVTRRVREVKYIDSFITVMCAHHGFDLEGKQDPCYFCKGQKIIYGRPCPCCSGTGTMLQHYIRGKIIKCSK